MIPNGNFVVKCKTENDTFMKVQEKFFENNVAWCSSRIKTLTLEYLSESEFGNSDVLTNEDFIYLIFDKEGRYFFFRIEEDLEDGLSNLDDYVIISDRDFLFDKRKKRKTNVI